jgi:hypothetical protein
VGQVAALVRERSLWTCSARVFKATATASKPSLTQSPVVSMTRPACSPLKVSVVR